MTLTLRGARIPAILKPAKAKGRLIPQLAATLSLALVGALLVVVAPVSTDSASAADPRGFDPGNIVSDAVFYDGNAMSADAVQAFLKAQVPTCRSSYACLSTFVQATPSIAASAGRCAAYAGRSAETAASIIARVGQACGISQKAMLVLLQKEQGLVGNSAPSRSRFDNATGFGCPDTAPCDATYSGFFYQIYYAAKQFKTYATSAGSFNYRAGRVNQIQFHPNRACGSSAVYIANQATAGLYNYTPYQPNAAAMANFYGVGDACSAYGNRNFYRIFADWFGSPSVGASLLTTSTSPAIYVVSGTVKYLIPDVKTLSSYQALGSVGTVSQSVIDSFSNGGVANRIIRSSSGAMFFHDAGIKLGIGSCTLVVDYGGACATGGYTQLTDEQICKFVTGPALSNLFATTTGMRYVIKDGRKREVMDDRSRLEAGMAGVYPVLTDDGVDGLPYGSPVVRDSVFLTERESGPYFLWSNGSQHPVASGTEGQYGAPARRAGALGTKSILALGAASATPFSGIVSSAGGLTALTATSRIQLTSSLPQVTASALPMSAELLGSYPSAALGAGSFVKSTSSGTVYAATADGIRSIGSWPTLVSLAGESAVDITTLPDSTIAGLAKGSRVLDPGTLAKTANSRKVFLVDGLNRRIPLPSFANSAAAGITGYATVGDTELDPYTQAQDALGFVWRCGTADYLAAGGSLHPMNPVLALAFNVVPTAVSASTCQALPKGKAASEFIRIPSGTIYQVIAGQKRPIASMTRWRQLDPTGAAQINVDAAFASTLPTGPAA